MKTLENLNKLELTMYNKIKTPEKKAKYIKALNASAKKHNEFDKTIQIFLKDGFDLLNNRNHVEYIASKYGVKVYKSYSNEFIARRVLDVLDELIEAAVKRVINKV